MDSYVYDFMEELPAILQIFDPTVKYYVKSGPSIKELRQSINDGKIAYFEFGYQSSFLYPFAFSENDRLIRMGLIISEINKLNGIDSDLSGFYDICGKLAVVRDCKIEERYQIEITSFRYKPSGGGLGLNGHCLFDGYDKAKIGLHKDSSYRARVERLSEYFFEKFGNSIDPYFAVKPKKGSTHESIRKNLDERMRTAR